MKVLLISTPIYQLSKTGLIGYGGLEHLVSIWAMEMHRLGHQVSVVCPEGSDLGEGIEIIPIGLRESEDAAYMKYKDRLQDFDCVMDNSWAWCSIQSQMEADRQLPIIHCYHSDPDFLEVPPPPIDKPCIVAFSKAQANIIRRRWNVACPVVHHSIDLNFYKPDPKVKRGNRYLWLARCTPEKGFLEVAYLAKKCHVPLDAFGSLDSIASQDYVRKCLEESDGRQIKMNLVVLSREQTVKEYQRHKALITWPNYVEIFGLTTVEAMACGTPVISKDSGAASELIEQGKTGFVVGSLEEAEELIRTDAVSRISPEACRRQAMKFSIERSAKGHLKLLDDVAHGLYW